MVFYVYKIFVLFVFYQFFIIGEVRESFIQSMPTNEALYVEASSVSNHAVYRVIDSEVRKLINESQSFASIREGLLARWQILCEKGVLQETGTDQDFRPYYVGFQGIMEQALANQFKKSITSLTYWILTPMPATPLCTKGEISPELVAPSIEADPLRSATVKARTTIVRDFLHQGGEIYAIYLQKGLSNRTSEQQAIYQKELENFAGRLFNRPLNINDMDTLLIGATCFLEDQKGDKHVFANQITQAKDPLDNGTFGLWFGPATHPAIQERVNAVKTFVHAHEQESVLPI